MKLFVLAIWIACVVFACGEKARFDNYRVYSINVENEEQLKVLLELETYPDGTLFLNTPKSVGQTGTLIVPPHKYADIAEFFEAYNIKNHITAHNLQKLVNHALMNWFDLNFEHFHRL